ncbi:hypothetical protein VPH35_037689 [Triticum aestivum]
MEGGLRKKTEIKSGKMEAGQGTEMEGELRKEQERIRKLRDQLIKSCESSTDPATQRIFLDQLDILWREEYALRTKMSKSGMEIQRAPGSDTDSDSDSGNEMGSSGVHPYLIRMEWRLRKETERDSSKGTEMESGKEQEMEGKLSKEHERLRKVRYQLNKRCDSTKDPATQRILLTRQEILWTKEQALLTVMRQSGMEIERDPDSDSGNEMGRDSPLISMEWGLSKGTERDASGKEMGQMGHDDLVVALSSHLEVLRREISFLRTEVTSRGNGLAGNGNKADQEHIIMSNLSLDDTLLKKKFYAAAGAGQEQRSAFGGMPDLLLVRVRRLTKQGQAKGECEQRNDVRPGHLRQAAQ